MNVIEHDGRLDILSQAGGIGPERIRAVFAPASRRGDDHAGDRPELRAARGEIARFQAGAIAEGDLQIALRRLTFETFVAGPLRRLIARLRAH
jgi:hypothetical protein